MEEAHRCLCLLNHATCFPLPLTNYAKVFLKFSQQIPIFCDINQFSYKLIRRYCNSVFLKTGLNPTETLWNVFTQVRKSSLQVYVYRCDSFYMTLYMTAIGLHNVGNISKHEFLKRSLKSMTFLQKLVTASLLVKMSPLP